MSTPEGEGISDDVTSGRCFEDDDDDEEEENDAVEGVVRLDENDDEKKAGGEREDAEDGVEGTWKGRKRWLGDL